MPRKSERTHPDAAAFPAGLSGPALRALSNAGIHTVAELAQWKAADIARLHGMGPKAVRMLAEALEAKGWEFRKSV